MCACMGPGMWAMALWMLLFWGAVIAAAVWVIRRLTPGRTGGSARRMLEERFARGEIDADEFEERKRALERSS